MLTASRIHTRWMISTDVPAVLAVEEVSFARPWSERSLRAVLGVRTMIAFVALTPDELLAGYCVYELHRDFLELHRLAVHPAVRQRGVATALVEKFKYKIGSHRRQFGCCGVPEWNLPAQKLMRKCGLRAIAVLKGDEPGQDADYLFEFRPGV